MAKRRSPDSGIIRTKPLTQMDYGDWVSMLQSETASIITDYVQQYVGIIAGSRQPGTGVYTNFDRVQATQTYQELAMYDLYAEVERDPHVSAVIGTGKLNVAGLPYDVSPYVAPGAKKATKRDEEIARFVREVLDGSGYFPQHLYNLMDALGMGFSVSEIIWEITERDGVRIRDILNRPQRRFQFDAKDRSLRLRTKSDQFFGESLPDKKFIVHRVSNKWSNPFGDAVDQSIYWMWLFKKMVLKFWMMHLEVGAASVPIVKHPAKASSETKAEAISIARSIRQGAYGRMPETFELIWAEAKNAISNAQTYDMFVQRVNDEISKAVNGQVLTTEASSATGTGSLALGQVHQGTQASRDLFRAHGLAATLNATLVRWLVDFNFAGIDGYPRFRFDVEDPEDLERESRIVSNLTGAGYQFNAEELSEKFNYTLTPKVAPVEPPPAGPTEGV